ncbi:MAG: hypothetical protein KF781_05035 [Chitinophagaceae bacterium]|nr:hypothetical protein [Chitinophagaceae bacterium]MCW5905884.1 hypothetical protein [Chitinophagaceae bacterium]
MLTEKEEKFIVYWEKNRIAQKKNTKQFIIGLTMGLLIGFTTLVLIFSGWYIRATMVANSKLSPIVFLIAVIVLSVFIAFLNRKYKWEQYEQQYLELLAKKKKTDKQVQQKK